MKQFTKALLLFVSQNDSSEIYKLMPEEIKANKAFFDEMFAQPEKHTFYILSSLFIDWINALQETHVLNELSEIADLFEFVEEDISLASQKEILEKVKPLIVKL